MPERNEVIIEKEDLDRRIEKLKEHLQDEPNKARESLLKLQLSTMTAYSNILDLRLKTWPEVN